MVRSKLKVSFVREMYRLSDLDDTYSMERLAWRNPRQSWILFKLLMRKVIAFLKPYRS